jgi:protein SCO1/2
LKSLPRNTGSALTCALFIVGFPMAPGAAAHDAQHGNTAQRSETRMPIGQFSLTDQSGRRFDLASIKGKIILIDFAYTTCPDVCPLMTAAMRTVQTNLGANERKRVYLLTVTTDPEIDTPKVLTAYAKRYHADLTNWAFLTGDPSSLAEVWKRFRVKVVRHARGLVDHTPLTAVIDQSGTMRFAYHGAAPDPKIILRDIRSLAGKDSLN